jgi:hypothetical protein
VVVIVKTTTKKFGADESLMIVVGEYKSLHGWTEWYL